MDESNGVNLRTNLHLVFIERSVSIIEEFDRYEHFRMNLLESQRYLIGSGEQEDSTLSTELEVDFSAPSAVCRQLACKEFNLLWWTRPAKTNQKTSIFNFRSND